MTENIDPNDLTNHPKSVEIYGTEPSERFVEDVGENGVEQPIVVTDDSHFTDADRTIISGHKRTEAAKQNGTIVPIGQTKTYETPAEELAAVLRYNDYRDKTFSEKMGEADAIREIEEKRAELRRKSTQNNDAAEQENFPEQESGQSRDKIANQINIGSGRTYSKAKKVWDAAQDGDTEAQELVEAIDAEDESIHGAYTTLKESESDDGGEPPEDTESSQEQSSDDIEGSNDEQETTTAAKRLAEETGEPVEKFSAQDIEQPDMDELEEVDDTEPPSGSDDAANGSNDTPSEPQESDSGQEDSGYKYSITDTDTSSEQSTDAEKDDESLPKVDAERTSGDGPFTKGGAEKQETIEELQEFAKEHVERVAEKVMAESDGDEELLKASGAWLTITMVEDKLLCPDCDNHDVELYLDCCGKTPQEAHDITWQDFSQRVKDRTTGTQEVESTVEN